MKKVVKKLKLSKETLRTLGGATLGKVAAGNADATTGSYTCGFRANPATHSDAKAATIPT
jgi:hypothetical protein